MNELYDVIKEAVFAYKNNPGQRIPRERLMNILFNRAEEILKALEQAIDLKEEVTALDAALKEATAEIKEYKTAAKPKKELKG